MKESWVKQQIKDCLKVNRIFYFMPSASIYGKSGIPDFICCKNGQFIAIEAKAGTNKATDLQKAKIADIQKAGGVTMIVNETNIEIAKAWLRDL